MENAKTTIKLSHLLICCYDVRSRHVAFSCCLCSFSVYNNRRDC